VPIETHVRFEKSKEVRRNRERNQNLQQEKSQAVKDVLAGQAPLTAAQPQAPAPQKETSSSLLKFRSHFKSRINAQKKSILSGNFKVTKVVKKKVAVKGKKKGKEDEDERVDFDEKFSDDEGITS